MTTTIYRIRNKKTGLFSKGSTLPRFSKKGKIWTGMGPLKNHLALVAERHYEDCEVISYELEEVQTGSFDPIELMREIDERREEKEAKRKLYYAKLAEDRARSEYERLKKQFGDKR